MLFDTHAHMDDRAFDTDRETLLSALPEQGIGLLMNRKGTCFVPFQQDDFRAKPTSCVADFTQILPAAEAALEGRQLEPMVF